MLTSSLSRLLTCAALLLTLCAPAPAQEDTPVAYKITGRVVDEKGKPVQRALVGLRVPDPQSPDLFSNMITDKDGRFTTGDSARRPVDKATFWVSAPPADAHVPANFMFGNLSYLDSSFAGQTVTFDGKQEVNLGDVRVQAQYHPVEIELLDSKGAHLAPDAAAWGNVMISVRDARGDILNEGGVVEAAKRKDRSSIVVALPEGSWELAATVFGDSYSWSPLDRVLVISRDSPKTSLAQVKLSDSDCKTNTAAPAEAATQEEARRELEKRGVPFTEEEFIERARRGNARIVRLFLAAGMNVDARDRNGQTALMAASGPWPGHADIICTLLAVGAAVNARDFDGKTPLINASSMVNAHIMRMLLDGGADPNVQTDNGWTPLMLAAQSGQANTVRLLLEAGADVNFKNAEGKTALAVAFRAEGNQVVPLLEKANRAKQ